MENCRVKNGYGLRTSTLSASVIGRFDASSEKRRLSTSKDVLEADFQQLRAVYLLRSEEEAHTVQKSCSTQKGNSYNRKANSRAWDDRYNKDASFQMSQLQGNHPVRKILHMQKCYPSTVRRLNDKGNNDSSDATTPIARPISSRWQRNPSPNNKNTAPPTTSLQQRLEPTSSAQTCRSNNDGGSVSSNNKAARRRRISHEYNFCRDKMAYNRTKGREAEVDGILTGKSPLEKNMPLFPAKATHQQLLGLVHRPSNPERPAPAVPRERKWLGDNVGWEGNRGLPTPPAGRNAKDGDVHPPWPSSQYPPITADPSL